MRTVALSRLAQGGGADSSGPPLPASHAKRFGETRCAILDQVSKQFMVPLIDHIVDSHAFGPHHKSGSNTEKQAERFLDKRGGMASWIGTNVFLPPRKPSVGS